MPPLAPPPLGLSRIGALRSFTTATFFKRAPLQMSDSRALRPLLSSLFSCGGLVLAWLKVGGGGGPPGGGGGGGGMGILLLLQHTPDDPGSVSGSPGVNSSSHGRLRESVGVNLSAGLNLCGLLALLLAASR